jgi:uncharacterized membrane protein (UPF0127 family)
MKLRLFIGLAVGLCGLSLTTLSIQAQDTSAAQSLQTATLHIGSATLNTQIAATEEQRERGLMFRAQMADNDGMIFLLSRVGPATFWMKNTLIPLSVAFIDRNGVILEIHDMKPQDETITRSDSNEVAYALETNVHWFSLNGIKPGDKITPPPATLVKSTSP